MHSAGRVLQSAAHLKDTGQDDSLPEHECLRADRRRKRVGDIVGANAVGHEGGGEGADHHCRARTAFQQRGVDAVDFRWKDQVRTIIIGIVRPVRRLSPDAELGQVL